MRSAVVVVSVGVSNVDAAFGALSVSMLHSGGAPFGRLHRIHSGAGIDCIQRALHSGGLASVGREAAYSNAVKRRSNLVNLD